jgi:dihydroflavonol-4-reductase
MAVAKSISLPHRAQRADHNDSRGNAHLKIYVVGGAGMIGGHAALHLRDQGHAITIGGRTPPQAGTPLDALPFLACDYIASPPTRAALGQFDALVFAAGNDIRHLPKGTDAKTHWRVANTEAVPRFFAAARDAGIHHAINIGSFYPQAMPSLVAVQPYVESRKRADDGVRALASPNFRAISVNAPFVVGAPEGLIIPMFKAYTDYALGRMAPMPEFSPPGGVNFISTRSLAEAVEGALLRGDNGHAYLVGDENLSFGDYFGAFFRAAGRAAPPVLDREHPLLPDSALYFGRGNTLFYEPNPAETAQLAYRRNDIIAAITAIVATHA